MSEIELAEKEERSPRCENCGGYFGERFDYNGELVKDYTVIGEEEFCICGNCQQTLEFEANDLATEEAPECPEDDMSDEYNDYWDEFHTEYLPAATEEVEAEMVKSIKERN